MNRYGRIMCQPFPYGWRSKLYSDLYQNKPMFVPPTERGGFLVSSFMPFLLIEPKDAKPLQYRTNAFMLTAKEFHEDACRHILTDRFSCFKAIYTSRSLIFTDTEYLDDKPCTEALCAEIAHTLEKKGETVAFVANGYPHPHLTPFMARS